MAGRVGEDSEALVADVQAARARLHCPGLAGVEVVDKVVEAGT